MATQVVNVVVNDDATFEASGSLAALPGLIAKAVAASGKATFSLPALIKLVQDLATDVPVLIADVMAVVSAPAPVPPAADVAHKPIA